MKLKTGKIITSPFFITSNLSLQVKTIKTVENLIKNRKWYKKIMERTNEQSELQRRYSISNDKEKKERNIPKLK